MIPKRVDFHSTALREWLWINWRKLPFLVIIAVIAFIVVASPEEDFPQIRGRARPEFHRWTGRRIVTISASNPMTTITDIINHQGDVSVASRYQSCLNHELDDDSDYDTLDSRATSQNIMFVFSFNTEVINLCFWCSELYVLFPLESRTTGCIGQNKLCLRAFLGIADSSISPLRRSIAFFMSFGNKIIRY